MKKLLFIDTETTGLDAEDRLCEVAYSIDGSMYEERFKPPVPIKVGAMAVSHITNRMVADRPPFIGSPMWQGLEAMAAENEEAGNYIFVAHNAPFDIKMLEKEGIFFKTYIDTRKLSHKLDVDDSMESQRLQYLRYYHRVEMPEAAAHSAEGDVAVLIGVYNAIVEKLGNPSIEEQIEISSKPILYHKIKFGKYKDSLIANIAATDRGYLEWLLKAKKENEAEGQDETDWIYTIEHYLNN